MQESHEHLSLPLAAGVMILVSLLLFFVPGVNGLIAGVIGGYLVGSVSRGVTAAVLPAIVLSAALWLLLAVLGLPILGLFAGVAVSVWIVLSDLGLLLGAAMGAGVHQLTRH